jgi:hypothetical protein
MLWFSNASSLEQCNGKEGGKRQEEEKDKIARRGAERVVVACES